MHEGLLPPYVEPFGPKRDDKGVIQAFVRHEPAGYSAQFHTEGPTLLADREVAAAVRIGAGTVLVRLDLPEGMEKAKATVETVLGAEGLSCVDEDSLLAPAAALQIVGIRMSSWDLWGTDVAEAFTALRGVAAGEECTPIFPLEGG